jgi:hypothetical protein
MTADVQVDVLCPFDWQDDKHTGDLSVCNRKLFNILGTPALDNQSLGPVGVHHQIATGICCIVTDPQ